jgi:hypothetical protein
VLVVSDTETDVLAEAEVVTLSEDEGESLSVLLSVSESEVVGWMESVAEKVAPLTE